VFMIDQNHTMNTDLSEEELSIWKK
jgi:hypothetical protein